MLYWIKILMRRLLRLETSINKLKKIGLKMGNNCSIQPGCILDPDHCWLISIGDDVTLAPRVHIVAHDASTKRHIGYTKIGLVEIGNKVFIGANSVVLPNVKIGDNVIIGANSVVTKDIPSNTVALGNPARVICSISEYIEKNRELMHKRPVYDESYSVRKDITNEQKQRMVKVLKDGIGYVK
jgi:maltose O-acetyltransferase